MGLGEAAKSLRVARAHLHRVQVAGFDPPDPVEAATFAFYAYENAIVAVAEARTIKWTKNHFEKAKLAEKLFNDGVLATDVSTKLPELNELRKSVAYGEPGPDLEALDLHALATELETFLDEVDAIIEAAKGKS